MIRSPRRHVSWTAVALAVVPVLALSPLSPRPSLAAAASDSTRAPGVADTVTVLKPVVVEAARGAASDRASSTVVHLDRSRVVRFSPSTVSDALVSVPGLSISRTGPWATQLSMRGLSGERVAVLVDGVRLETGRGHGAQTSLVPVDRIESIEAQPGAGSAVNGSDAMAGTVEFSTHRPLLAAQRQATLTLDARGAGPGDEQTEGGHLRWLSRDIGFELSGIVSRQGELVTPDSTYAQSGYHEQDVTGRTVARLGASTVDYEHSSHRSYDIGLPAFSNPLGTWAQLPLQSRDVDRLEVAAPAAGRLPALRLLAVQQEMNDWFDETDVSAHFVRGRQISTSRTDMRSRVPFRSRSLQPGVTFRNGRLFGEYRYESTIGAVANDSFVTNMSGVQTFHSTFATEAVPPARRQVWAAGASGWVDPFGVRLDGGLRWDRMRSSTEATSLSIRPSELLVDRRVSGEAGISRGFGAWTPYAHGSTNFRAPNLDERFAHMIVHGGLLVFGNDALRPEVSTTGEVGVRGATGDGLLRGVRVSAYRTEATDLITIQYAELVFGVPRFEYRNVHRARLDGIEAEGELRAGGVALTVAAAFPRGRDLASGEPIADIGAPTTTFDLRLPVPRIVPQGTFLVRARWSDAHRAGLGEEILERPAFWTLAAETGFTALGVRWSLVGTNLTNTLYSEPTSFVPEAGRSFSVSARRNLALPWLTFAKDH